MIFYAACASLSFAYVLPVLFYTIALSKMCSTSVRYPCAVVSVVGRQLRNALAELGGAMRVLHGVPVHMISEAAEDLNFSFVVDEEHADSLVRVSL